MSAKEFELVADQPTQRVEEPLTVVCGNCQHYRPFRGAETGRVHPSKAGTCNWQPQVKWPMSIRRFGFSEKDPAFERIKVHKDLAAESCQCYVQKEKGNQ